MTPIKPLPQAILPGKWTVFPGTGAVEIEGRRMWTPMRDSEDDALVRAHEMAHVRFSPRAMDIEPQHHDSYLFAEDGRIGLLAARIALQTVPHVKTRMPLRASPRAKARIILAITGGGREERYRIASILSTMKPEHFACADEAVRVLEDHPDDPESARTAARIIDRLPASHRDPAPDDLPIFAGHWGAMHEEHPPLPRLSSLRARRALCPDERGAALRYPHRRLLDRRMFARPTRVTGVTGTLLVDASLSMGFTPEQVAHIVESAPATIAVYSGVLTDGDYMEAGYLRIVARDGRMVAARDVLSPGHAGGNVVDGPALEWLSRQQEPRVWYSDGQMTGYGDRPASLSLVQEVEHLVKHARIRRCGVLDEVLRAFRPRPRGRQPELTWVQGELPL